MCKSPTKLWFLVFDMTRSRDFWYHKNHTKSITANFVFDSPTQCNHSGWQRKGREERWPHGRHQRCTEILVTWDAELLGSCQLGSWARSVLGTHQRQDPDGRNSGASGSKVLRIASEMGVSMNRGTPSHHPYWMVYFQCIFPEKPSSISVFGVPPWPWEAHETSK